MAGTHIHRQHTLLEPESKFKSLQVLSVGTEGYGPVVSQGPICVWPWDGLGLLGMLQLLFKGFGAGVKIFLR